LLGLFEWSLNKNIGIVYNICGITIVHPFTI
jgi:hypothetical protein